MSTKKKPAMTDDQIRTRLVELNASVNEALALRNELDEREKRAKVLPLVGKCFKYRNSYSFGESWWLYAIVIGTTEGQKMPRAITFQDDGQGQISIAYEHHGSTLTNGGWTEIARSEFDRAVRAITKKVLVLASGRPTKRGSR